MNDAQAVSGQIIRSPLRNLPELRLKSCEIGLLRREDETVMINLLRRNLDSFEEAGSVLASAYRRMERLFDTYTREGSVYVVLRDLNTGICVGGAGLGTLAGLSVSEGMGEIRELVVDANYRRQGHGALLLSECLEKARGFGYKRLYLETTPQMSHAQKLFRRFNFQPLTEKRRLNVPVIASQPNAMPCYFITTP